MHLLSKVQAYICAGICVCIWAEGGVKTIINTKTKYVIIIIVSDNSIFFNNARFILSI